MKLSAIVFCLLGFAAIVNSLNLKHNGYYKIDSLPNHEDLLKYINIISVSNSKISFMGCNVNSASWRQTGNDVHISGWVSSHMFCQNDRDREVTQLLDKIKKLKVDSNIKITLLDEKNNKVLSLTKD